MPKYEPNEVRPKAGGFAAVDAIRILMGRVDNAMQSMYDDKQYVPEYGGGRNDYIEVTFTRVKRVED